MLRQLSSASSAKFFANRLSQRYRNLNLQKHNNLSYFINTNDLSRYRINSKRTFYLSSAIAPHATRQFSFTSIPKFAFKLVRLPAAIGGGIAAGGSYIVYKVEEATAYTGNQLDKFKDMASSASDHLSGFFKSVADKLPKGKGDGAESSNSNAGDNGGADNGGPGGGSGAAGTAAAAGALLSEEDESSENSDDEDVDDRYARNAVDDDEEDDDEHKKKIKDNTDDQILNLTKQMIEIRNLLSKIDQNDSLKLPSIVVVGSQSSGKSSVLEAIVGKQFLPKGNNMVTRRPIELTLINDPQANMESAQFTDLKMETLTNFDDVSRILFELNLAVPETTAISSDPIRLTIRSPRAPDLTLIDLPGYIQVQAEDQPRELKQKIRDVCMKYLEPPNIILAISPADVDLANSSALRAAKLIDPLGERTLGVITKMDLIEPKRARDILKNNKYPLKMGYVGVISKAPEKASASSLFLKKKSNSNLSKELQIHEQDYFLKTNEKYFYNSAVGTKLLKKKLMKILEKSMSASLKPTHRAIQQELEDASYRFKVEFNDRLLTPETYLASSLDSVKVAVKEFSAKFGRNELRSLLRSELDQRVLDLLALRYWNKPLPLDGTPITSYSEPILEELPDATENDLYWHRKLDLTTSSLTKLGVGRLSTTLVINALLDEMNNITNHTNLQKHPLAKEIVLNSAMSVLNSRFYSTADQVENCIKPYKYEIDLEDREWTIAKEHSLRLLSEEVKQCSQAYKVLRDEVGSRKLKNVVSHIEKSHLYNLSNNDPAKASASLPSPPSHSDETLQFSKKLLQKGREAIFLQDRLAILQMRMTAVKSKACATKEFKYKCPEIFLNSVVDKLTQTAVLFLNVELLSDFYYNFPRDLDVKLSTNSLSKELVEKIAKEDPRVKSHIELQQRKELLEDAMSKIEHIIALRNTRAHFA